MNEENKISGISGEENETPAENTDNAPVSEENGVSLNEELETLRETFQEKYDETVEEAASMPVIQELEEGEEEEEAHEGHHHEADPHIWLSPAHAGAQARNICAGLSAEYPEYAAVFEENLAALLHDLQKLEEYGKLELAELSSREILTFHDGFAYLAHAFDIEIVEAIEEESGAEASAKELIHLIEEVRHHDVRAIFVETNGSGSAASIIAAETGAHLSTLSMAMSGDDYFAAMYANIDALKEALK